MPGGAASGKERSTRIPGGQGALELEFRVDSAGEPEGVARFETETGRNRAQLGGLTLSADSLTATLTYQGSPVRSTGTRTGGEANGSYVILSSDGLTVVDGGSWQADRDAQGS